MIGISFAITVCTELFELNRLVSVLQEYIRPEDEIVIQYDEESVTEEVLSRCNELKELPQFQVISFKLDKDFASFKNNFNSFCSNEYIFQIDADEIPNTSLLEHLPSILENNDVDVMLVPRINTVEGITDRHIKKWGWSVDDNNWINFPDFQMRIYKNSKDIKWTNKVHERLDGFKKYAYLPSSENFSLYHPKDISKQEKQNTFYSTIAR